MNIAMFSNTYLPMLGGIEKSVATFAEDYRRQGHRCLVVTPEMSGAEESSEGVLRLPALKNIGGSAFSLKLPVPGLLSSRMAEFSPDIVHSHHPFLMGDSALRCAWRLGAPLVLTYHTVWDRYADFFPNDTLKNIVVRLSVEYANLCDCVVAPSVSLERFIRELGVTAPIRVIPTGIELPLFSSGNRQRGRAHMGIGEDAHVAGYVGRIGAEKNLEWLCEAAAKWCATDERAHFAVVGPLNTYHDTLRAVFAKAGLEDRLVLPGPMMGEALADAYAALDVFTFASHSDTQGIVLAEAMAAGLPIVALDAPGAREAVANGANGILLPTESGQEEYAAAIGRVVMDRARMGAASRERALRYDRIRTAGEMLAMYAGLLDEAASMRTDAGGAGRLRAEWRLISTKAAATIKAVTEKR